MVFGVFNKNPHLHAAFQLSIASFIHNALKGIWERD